MTLNLDDVTGSETPPVIDAPAYEGIAILGSHPETKQKAPFDKNWLIFACSPDNSPFGYSDHAGPLPRVDLWFELHKPIADVSRPYRYLRWIEEQDFPVMMRDRTGMGAFRKAVEYPEAALKARFGPYAFTSSVAYMLAYAIVEAERLGVPQIGIFGIMQQSKNEYLQHRTGTQQMIYEAHKAGLGVLLPREAEQLLTPPPETW